MGGRAEFWTLIVDIINDEFIQTGEPLTIPLLHDLIRAVDEQLTELDP